jgi:hypothetical protein
MSSNLGSTDPPEGERPPYVGAMLRGVWDWVRDQLVEGVVAAGWDRGASHSCTAPWSY